MNEFTNYIANLIEEKGTNTYQISKVSGLNKTSLQRLLKGERLPKEEFMEKLCDYLCVTPMQRIEVRRLYQIQKIGKNTYENRLFIKNMLENPINIKNESHNLNLNKHDINIDYLLKKPTLIIHRKYEIHTILRDIIEHEIYCNDNPSIKLTVPFSFEYLMNLIMSCQQISNKKANIEHIIKFDKNSKAHSDANYNLRTLSNVLPFALNSLTKYVPYYYYSIVNTTIVDEVALPYYILTNNFLVQISRSFDKIVVFTDKELYNLYQQFFEQQKKHCNKLLTVFNNSYELMNFHLDKCTSLKRSSSIKSQPSFGVYFTEDIIEKKLISGIPNREKYITLAKSFYKGIVNEKAYIRNYFTKDGLDLFVKDGLFDDIPKSYMGDKSVKNFIVDSNKDDKLFFLNSLYNDIEKDMIYSRVIDTSKFTLSKTISIAYYEMQYIVFFHNGEDGNVTGCYINEQELLSAYSDFIASLEDSGYIYDKKDTLKIIRNIIDALNKMDE